MGWAATMGFSQLPFSAYAAGVWANTLGLLLLLHCMPVRRIYLLIDQAAIQPGLVRK